MSPSTADSSLHQYLKDASDAEKINRSIVGDDEAVYDAVNVLMELERDMAEAATKLEFEKAAHLRDQIKELKRRAGLEDPPREKKPVKYAKG
jgi:excinuclease ABC subunit B